MSRYIVFCKPTCPFCTKAEELLEGQALEYTMVEVGDTWEQLKEAFRWKTVPMILEVESDVLYHFIGGYTDLVEYLDIEGQDGDVE